MPELAGRRRRPAFFVGSVGAFGFRNQWKDVTDRKFVVNGYVILPL
jgi:hypothetical protein